jgi:hypothetical protein
MWWDSVASPVPTGTIFPEVKKRLVEQGADDIMVVAAGSPGTGLPVPP